MKKLLLLLILFIIGCGLNDQEVDADPCMPFNRVFEPEGYSLRAVGFPSTLVDLLDYQFLDEELGFALFKNSQNTTEIIKSSNRGLTWQNLNANIDDIPFAFEFIDENNGFVSIDNIYGECIIYSTNDGGITWTKNIIEQLNGFFIAMTSDEAGNLYGILSTDVGYGGYFIYKSMDNGISWESIFHDNYPDIEIAWEYLTVVDEIIYICSSEGRVFGINSNGEVQLDFKASDSVISDLIIIDNQHFIVSDYREIKASNDGGESWETILENTSRIIGFDDQLNGIALARRPTCVSQSNTWGVSSHFITTSSGGAEWNEETASTFDLFTNFQGSQKVAAGKYYIFINDDLYHLIKE